jgi:hypothetical protein
MMTIEEVEAILSLDGAVLRTPPCFDGFGAIQWRNGAEWRNEPVRAEVWRGLAESDRIKLAGPPQPSGWLSWLRA